MNVVFAPRALRDLEGIAAYLSDRSPSGAIHVLAAIKSSIDALAAFPEIGRIVDDTGHRRFPVLGFPYVVFYRIAESELLILHLRHTSRRPIDPTADL
jgi:toxin ParE1/3/4